MWADRCLITFEFWLLPIQKDESTFFFQWRMNEILHLISNFSWKEHLRPLHVSLHPCMCCLRPDVTWQKEVLEKYMTPWENPKAHPICLFWICEPSKTFASGNLHLILPDITLWYYSLPVSHLVSFDNRYNIYHDNAGLHSAQHVRVMNSRVTWWQLTKTLGGSFQTRGKRV